MSFGARGQFGLALAALAFALFPLPAFAQIQREGITDFASDITVEKTGTLDITETISVMALGFDIRHGIYRDFPTDYTDQFGDRTHVRFDVTAVTLDGHDEPYTTEALANGERVQIGDPNADLQTGPHVFVLSYQTNRQIHFGDSEDDLYWNVTGNGWVFPILHARATIHLPQGQGARILRDAFYTGAQGSTGQDAAAVKLSDNEIRFDTTAPLGPDEGLTVAIGFSKGAVVPPGLVVRAYDFLLDNEPAVVAILGVLAALIYYLLIWWRVGRDPPHGTIIPLFAPPDQLSPEAVRYIHRMAYDRKTFAATLVGMAVKGYLKIAEDGSEYTLTRTGKSEADANLAPGERATAAGLFSAGDAITLSQSHHSVVADAISRLRDELSNECEPRYFVGNVGWWVVGVAILVVTLVGVFATASDSGGLPLIAIVVLLAGGIAAMVFYRLLKAPTLRGGAIRDQIEGFRRFLDTAEKDRLEALNPPEVTPQVFEKFLPYAIALDCENRWSKRFEAEAAAAAADPSRSGMYAGYVPLWYAGAAFDRFGVGGLTSAIGTSLATSAAAAATAPGSSSGFGGGGFSGGGGGGGGGGGW